MDDLSRRGFLQGAAAAAAIIAVPAPIIKELPPDIFPPQPWLICDGRAVSRTFYSDLFAMIGSTYGDGDGTDTFNLPDLRGRIFTPSTDGMVTSEVQTHIQATVIRATVTNSPYDILGAIHTVVVKEEPSCLIHAPGRSLTPSTNV